MSKKKADVVDMKTRGEIEKTEWQEVTYICPVRGLVTQKVKVTKFKTKVVETRDFVRSSDPLINDFDMEDVINQDLNEDGPGDDADD